MAPITRHGSSMIRTPGYETLGNTLAGRATHNAMAYDQNTTIDEIQGFDLLSPNLLVPESYDEAIHPLRAAADRVGREVEKFAEELDRHDPRKHTAYSSERYDAATDLADRYIAIAQDTANRLYKKHAPKHQNQLHHRWRRQIEALRNDGEQAGLGESIFEAPSDDDEASSTASGTNVTTVKDLEHWQHEERTWILFKDLLEFRFAPPQAEVRERKRQQMAEIGPIHRFSSERKIWNRFIIEDDLARERQVVLTWLEDTAESSGNDLDMVVEQLEGGVKRGKGLWAQGWLYTKEAIKAKKRLGSWSRPGELGSPGITPNLANTDEIEALVTQLDPDAAVRQGQVLKKEDAYYERATWLACWELLRRGKSWEEIRDWCEDRVEGWRAVSLRGSMRSWDQGLDDDGQLSQSESDDDDHEDDGISQLSRSSGHRDGALWRRMCYAISQKGGMNDYERAVYGTQAGDLNSVLKVCRSWDDFLFAHYKSLLLCQFDAYLQAQYPDRLSPALTGKFKMSSASQLQSEVSSAGRAGQIVVAGLISNPMTMSETARPLKIIQGVLVSSTLLDFVQYQGRQISRIANEDVTKPSEIIPVLPESPEPSHISSPIDVTDFDCLRVLTHILLLSQDLGLEIGQGDDRVAVENILVAYIDFLKLAGKLAIIPMYASRLSPERQLMTLGRVLVDETAAPQRRELIRLMYSYDIEVPRVVEVQMKSILNELGASTHSETENLDHPSLILSSETKIPSMKSNFLGKEITLEDERLIRAFQWYLELEGHWKQTFAMGAYVYKRFFELGHLSAARELIGIMPSSLISTTKTSSIIGRTFDINNLLPDDEGEDESLGPTIKARSTRSLQQVAQDQWTERRGTFERLRRQVEVLRSQAKIYIGLEQLTMALMALQEWEMIKDGAPAPSELTAARHWKEDLGVQFQEIEMAMYPLLHGWLTDIPKDETAEIDSIRNKYLPEIILAYNSVIIFMGATVSNNILLSSMELSTIVAAPDSDILPCIVASGHLQNLVRSFAVASKTMVTASKGQKRNKSAKKSATGQTMALWQNIFGLALVGGEYLEYEDRDDPESLHLKSQEDTAVWPTSVIIEIRLADEPTTRWTSCIKSCHQLSIRLSSTSHNAAPFRTLVPSARNGPPASARRYASTESALSKTGLFDLHVANGGKMVPFAGYSMPVQYSGLSVGDSHRWTREKASLFDVGHMVQHRFSGAGATALLLQCTPASILTLPPLHSTLSTLLHPNTGGIVDDCIITRLGPELFYVVTNAGCRAKDLAYLRDNISLLSSSSTHQTNKKLDWEVLSDWGLVALQGPLSVSILESMLANQDPTNNLKDLLFGQCRFITVRLSDGTVPVPILVSRGGYTGEDGFEISLPPHLTQSFTESILQKATPDRLRLAGLGARDSLRLEAGMCLYGHDLNDSITPVEAGLSWIIGKDRRTGGGFHGADVILRQLKPVKDGGAGVTKRRVGLVIEGAPAREGASIVDKATGESVGSVTSGCPSPTAGVNIAMGYVKTGWHKAGTEVEVLVRGKKRVGIVRKMPFVETKYWKGTAPS